MADVPDAEFRPFAQVKCARSALHVNLGSKGIPVRKPIPLLIQWLFGAYDCLVREKQRYFESIRLHELASIPQTSVGKCLVRFPAMLGAYFRVSTPARYRSSVSTSAGSATVSAIS
jgi:hypothetical protein